MEEASIHTRKETTTQPLEYIRVFISFYDWFWLLNVSISAGDEEGESHL